MGTLGRGGGADRDLRALQGPRAAWRMRKVTAQKIYGAHVPMRMEMERQILGQFQRLPGLDSELCGLRTMLDEDETLELEDVLDRACATPRQAAPVAAQKPQPCCPGHARGAMTPCASPRALPVVPCRARARPRAQRAGP